MKRKIILNSIFIVLALFIPLLFVGANSASAQSVDQLVWGGFQDELKFTTGLGDRDPREMIVGIIRIALGFLGILSVTIIMMAGFKWMVSGGNEDSAAIAKTMMFNGVMGLIIILASLSLANFVISSILGATRGF